MSSHIRRLAGALATGALLAVFAVSGAAAETVLRAKVHADLKNYDPIWTTAYITRNHGYMVYDTLFAMDENFNVQPQMAESYEVSDDGKVYTITLRDGLKWHDGPPVRPEDCIASIERWGKRDGMGQQLMAVVDGFEVVDAKTFKIKLKEPWGLVLAALGMATHRQVALWRDSTTLFTHAREIDDRNHLAAYWLGEALMQQDDPSGAAEQFAAARSLNPAYDLAWFKEGSARLRTGQNAEAAVALEEYVRLRPHQFKGWMNLGGTYGRLGRLEDALRCFERAVEIAPQDGQARANRDRARALLSSGSPEGNDG